MQQNQARQHEIHEDQFEFKSLGPIVQKTVSIQYQNYINKLILSYHTQVSKDSNEIEEKQIDLQQVDDFTQIFYKNLLETKRIVAQQPKKKKIACVHSMVSQNRLRYEDEQFNLDLAYITKRVIAMGFPASGVRKIYRNPVEQVQKFFEKHHNNKVKVYNLCDDSFIDSSQMHLNNGQIKVAYFPMMDHNPGKLKQLFYFNLDMLLYLMQDEENTAAVHCKAGKGRTGLAVSSYLIFMEACSDAYEAVEFFNKRRTSDGKGMAVASQKRYLHYFDRFMKSTFKPPYKQIIVPYLRNPMIFEDLFKPTCQLNLMTVCLGPFKINPNYYQIKLSLRSFEKTNLFKVSNKRKPYKQYTQNIIFNKISEQYYILMVLHEDIAVTEDIRIDITTPQLKGKSSKLTFHYWLNARYVFEGVGKVHQTNFTDKEQLSLSSFMMKQTIGRESSSYNLRTHEEYEVISPSTIFMNQEETIQVQQESNLKSTDTGSTNQTLDKRSKTIDHHSKQKSKSEQKVNDLKDLLKSNINRYEQQGLKRINAIKDVQGGRFTFFVKGENKETIISHITPERSKSSFDNSFEYKNDASIMRKAEEHEKLPNAIFSDSDDDQCIVNDDSEEGNVSIGTFQGGDIGGSFKQPSGYKQTTPQKSKHVLRAVNTLTVNRVSTRKTIPTNNSPMGSVQSDFTGSPIRIDKNCDVVSEEDDDVKTVSSKAIKGSYFHAQESKQNEDDDELNKAIPVKKRSKDHRKQPSISSFFNQSRVEQKSQNLNPFYNYSRTSIVNNNPSHQNILSGLQIQHQHTAQFNEQQKDNFNDNSSSGDSKGFYNDDIQKGKLINQGRKTSNMSVFQYSASDENEIFLFKQNQNQNKIYGNNLVSMRQEYREVAKSKISMEISERINEIQQNYRQQQNGASFNIQDQIKSGTNTYLSHQNLNKFSASSAAISGLINTSKPFLPSTQSYKYKRFPGAQQNTQDCKKLIHVTLSCEELDKFKQKNLHPDIKVMTTFYCDPQIDNILFSTQNTTNIQKQN